MAKTRQQWFDDAKYGLFIHWGLYSILAGEYKGRKTDRIAEWIENNFDIPVEEYEKLAEQFNPTQFNADAFVKRAKEQWGVKYIVLTASTLLLRISVSQARAIIFMLPYFTGRKMEKFILNPLEMR